VPVLRACLLRDRTFGHKIIEWSTIHQIQVKSAIIVVVEQGNTRPHRLEEILSRTVCGLMQEVDTVLCCLILEIGSYPLRRGDRLRKAACQNGCQNSGCRGHHRLKPHSCFLIVKCSCSLESAQ